MSNVLEEREISIRDLIWAVCMHWRRICVAATGVAIVVILLGGLLRGGSGEEELPGNDVTAMTERLESMELSEESQDNVDRYMEYLKAYESQRDYNKYSLLMQMDANAFYLGKISYYVDNHFQLQYPVIKGTNNIRTILATYESVLHGDLFVEQLQQLADVDEQGRPYLGELVKETSKYDDGSFLDKSSEEEDRMGSDEEAGIMTIYVYGQEEEFCQDLMQLVRASMDESKDEIEEQFGAHDLVMVENSCNLVADNQLLQYQGENINRLAAYRTNVDNQQAKLSEEEQAYVDLESQIAAAEEQMEETESPQEEPVSTSLSDFLSLKMILLGIIAGVALAGFAEIVLYVLSDKFRLADDLETLYGTMLFGHITSDQPKRKKLFGFIDDFLARMRYRSQPDFSREKSLEMAAAGIRIAAGNRAISKVYVTGAHMGQEEKDVAEKLAGKLEQDGIQLVSGAPILYDPESLEDSAKIGSVVLVERAGKSSYQEIAQEFENCAYHGIQVLGLVTTG